MTISPNNEPLNIGDEVEVFYNGTAIIDSRYLVKDIILIGNELVYKAEVFRFSGNHASGHEFSSKGNFKWRKVSSAKEISNLILPGKPLLVVGSSGPNLTSDKNRNQRSSRVARAIELLSPLSCVEYNPPLSKSDAPYLNKIDLDLNNLRNLVRNHNCKDNIFLLCGVHRYNDFNQSEAIDRVVSFLMRNKKRRIVLTGDSCSSPKILKKVANTINFIL